MTRSLVVAYGNPLRGDDGAGPVVAEVLAAAIAARPAGDPRFDAIDIHVEHQLGPELARDIAGAALVVLVDAGVESAPGTIRVHRVEEGSGPPSHSMHTVEPAAVVDLARALYGRAPEVFTVSIGTASMEVGEGLSPVVEAAVPAAVEAVVAIIERPGDGLMRAGIEAPADA